MALDNPDPGFRDYLSALRRRRFVVVAAAAGALLAAVVFSQLQTPRYAATAELLLRQRTTEALFNQDNGQRNDPTRALNTEIRVLNSGPVQDRVRKKLGVVPDVSGRPIGQTDVVAIRVESNDAKLAAAAANAYAEAYIDHRRTQAVDDLFQAGQKIQEKLAELQRQIDAASPTQQVSLEENRAFFESERDKLQLTAELTTGGAEIVKHATVPSDPFSPTPVRNAVVALSLGLLIGAGVALLIEYLDDSIKDKEGLERAASGLPVLGLIPAVPGWKAKDESRIVSISEPTSPPAEAYRTLRTAVEFLGLDRPVRVIQVTSPRAREGKTTTVSNLGVALAGAGYEVVVVCCDLRRPRLHEFFGVSNTKGFTSLLLGESPAASLQPVPNVDRLGILPSGPIPPNPSELLSSRRAGEVLASLPTDRRIVIVDSPPVLPVTDALVLARWVDVTLLVCSVSETSRKEVARAVELLKHVDAPLVGTILNGVKAEGSYGYEYAYAYAYGGKGQNGSRRQRVGRTRRPLRATPQSRRTDEG
jgi:succinoglycan biosynthesis transport protein ExoP